MLDVTSQVMKETVNLLGITVDHKLSFESHL